MTTTATTATTSRPPHKKENSLLASLGVLRNGRRSGMTAAAGEQNPVPTALASADTTPHSSCVTRTAPGISGLVLFRVRHVAARDS